MLRAYRASAPHHVCSATWSGHCCCYSKTEQNSSWIPHILAVLHRSFSIFPSHLQKPWQMQTGCRRYRALLNLLGPVWTSSHFVFLAAQAQLQWPSYLCWDEIRRKWGGNVTPQENSSQNEYRRWQSVLTWHGTWNEPFLESLSCCFLIVISMLRRPQLCT